MTTLAHIFAAIGIFFGSLFGGHAVPPQTTTTDQATTSASTESMHSATATTQKTPNPCDAQKDDTYYQVIGSTVCANYQPIAGADPATFVQMGGPIYDHTEEAYFGKDKNKVYADDAVVTNADPATFSVITGSDYMKDKNSVYCGLSQPEVISTKPTTFKVLVAQPAREEGARPEYATDGQNVFSQCNVLNGADVASFKPVPVPGGKVMSDFAVDVNHVYGDELYGVNKSEIMDGVDPTSFAIIGMNGGGTEYAKDKNHIYVTYPPFTPMQGVDMATFAIVGTNTMDPYGGYYARDKNNVYYEGLPVAGADPTTFLMASGADLDTIDARDKNHTYVSGHLAD